MSLSMEKSGLTFVSEKAPLGPVVKVEKVVAAATSKSSNIKWPGGLTIPPL